MDILKQMWSRISWWHWLAAAIMTVLLMWIMSR